MQLRDLDRMPLQSTAAVAAIMCCLASAPSTYAGNEGSATGRLVPGGWLQPATPPGPPPVAQTVRPDQASPPEPVLASGLPKPAPDDNPIPIRPVRARSAVPRPVIIHRAKPPAPARTGPRPDGTFNSDSPRHLGGQIAQLRVSKPSQAADSFAGVPTASP